MQTVMQKAQELAEAILASDIYREMKSREEDLQSDSEAAEAVNRLARQRQRVEDLLSSCGMDPEELKRANADMIQAEQEMNTNEKVVRLKTARKDFSTMMDNVNRVLRLVITGEVRDDDTASACPGNCSSCSGC